MQTRSIRPASRWLALLFFFLAAGLIAGRQEALAQAGGDTTWLQFDTELQSLNLSVSGVGLPVGMGGSGDYSWVGPCDISVTLSSQRLVAPGPASVGQATAWLSRNVESSLGVLSDGSLGDPPPINPDELHGELFYVSSFFDVFFDITVTDNDPLNNFAGQPDGASLMFSDNGPAHMTNFWTAVFDKDAPQYGLLPPPEDSAYIGHFDIEIPLGVDLNGNGENDKVKFTLVNHELGGNRSYIVLPDGTVIDTFDSFTDLSGAVVDESTDPPFGPFTLSGPTTASSTLQNQLVPEPSSLVMLLSCGLIVSVGAAWRCRRGRCRS